VSDNGPWELDLSVEAIRQRAEVRRAWLRGQIGNPRPWCAYCRITIHGEFWWEQEAQAHHPGCPVPEALAARTPDFDALLVEVERLRGTAAEGS
jgi:hypothetical protein